MSNIKCKWHTKAHNIKIVITSRLIHIKWVKYSYLSWYYVEKRNITDNHYLLQFRLIQFSTLITSILFQIIFFLCSFRFSWMWTAVEEIPLHFFWRNMNILFWFIGLNFLSELKSDQNISNDEFVLHMTSPYKSISKYSLYRDVSIINFVIPINTEVAKFSFKAIEQKCDPKAITVHLKSGSFPVINPQNISFPDDYLSYENRWVKTIFFLNSENPHFP